MRTAFAVVLVVAGLVSGHAAAEEAGPCAKATERAVLTADGEPGPPLVVRGRVFHADGERPAAEVILYVYQTDATGLYVPRGTRSYGAPRLRAWMRTDARGRYEYRTIRPGSYPDNTIPAHVHTQLWGPGVPPQYGPDLLFDDDPKVTEGDRRASAEAGRFAWVARPALEGATLVVTHVIRLKASGDRFEESTAHGQDACEADAGAPGRGRSGG